MPQWRGDTLKVARPARAHPVLLSIVVVMACACGSKPALLRAQRELSLIHSVREALLRSAEAEKSAVLASTDEESRQLANDAERCATTVNQARTELRQLVDADGRPEVTAQLDAFDAAWAESETVDKRLLALAVANTNLKATRLSVEEGAQLLNRFVDLAADAQRASADPSVVRNLLFASISALRVQSLLAAHIPSADTAEMSALEKRIAELSEDTSRRLLAVGKTAAQGSPAQLAEATRAWGDYQRVVAEVVRLSRQNTNVLSFDVSVHEKRHVTQDCLTALDALLQAVESAQTATR
jgi:hypothetical protein